MGYIMNRSFADHMGFKWPKHIACMVDGKPVTYAELLDGKRERQRARLARVRLSYGPVRHAAFIWTFKVEVDIPYGGWHLYIRALKKDWWLRRFEDDLAQEIVRAYPCGLLPLKETFYEWKEAFAKTYSRPGRFRRQGLVPIWIELESGHIARWERI